MREVVGGESGAAIPVTGIQTGPVLAAAKQPHATLLDPTLATNGTRRFPWSLCPVPVTGPATPNR
jgi:hypothetical protein